MTATTQPTVLLGAFVLAALVACDKDVPQVPPVPPGGVILAFGDSLTYGQGARADESYPAVLERLVTRRVVSAGVPGERTDQGLLRLADELREHAPDLLLLLHGGNDLLTMTGEDKAARNIRAMIRLARERYIPVVLIGVPRPKLRLSGAAEFYGTIATELGIPFEGEVLAQILADPAMKRDPVHPNAAGYRRLAEAMRDLLEACGAI